MTTPDQVFATVRPAKVEDTIPRDGNQRPKIKQADGTEIPYTRVSTLAKALDETTKLQEWSDRMVARGVAISPDLIAAFAGMNNPNADSDTKRLAKDLVEQAKERAGSNMRRTMGTAIHLYVQSLTTGAPMPHVPDSVRPLLRDFQRATVGVTWLASELFVVNDRYRCAGTFDLAGQVKGQKPRVWDAKTGSVGDYKALSFAIQLAAYATAQLYNPITGERRPLPDIDLEVGHIAHLDQDTGKVRIYDIDLRAGVEALELALKVRQFRARRDIMIETVGGIPKTVMQRLAGCASIDDLRALHAETGASWGPREQAFADSLAQQFRS